MKLFGKKTLAMLLAVAMMLSVCPMSFADPTPAPELTIEGDATRTVKVGDADVTLSAKLGAEPATVTWSSNAEAVATVTAAGVVHFVAAGTAVITATAEGPKTATVTFNVIGEGSKITAISTANSKEVTVAFGTSKANAVAELKKISFTQTWDTPAVSTTGNFTSWVECAQGGGEATPTYDGSKPGDYYFKPVSTAFNPDTVANSGVCKVTVSKAKITAVTPFADQKAVKDSTENDVKATLPTALKATVNGATATFTIGDSSKDYSWTISGFDGASGKTNTFTLVANNVTHSTHASSGYYVLDEGVELPTVKVTMVNKLFPAIKTFDPLVVAKGTTVEQVLAKLNAAPYNAIYAQTGEKLNFTVGTSANFTWTAPTGAGAFVGTAANMTTGFTFTLTPSQAVTADYGALDPITVTVYVKDDITVTGAAYTYIYESAAAQQSIPACILSAADVNNLAVGEGGIDFQTGTYGAITKTGTTTQTYTYVPALTAAQKATLSEGGTLTDTLAFRFVGSDGFIYKGNLTVTIIHADIVVAASATNGSYTFSDLIAQIKTRNPSATYVDLTDWSACGALYESSSRAPMSRTDFALSGTSSTRPYLGNLYFEADGSGDTFVIDYNAYNSANTRIGTGRIYITSHEMLVLDLTLKTSEICDFDAEQFQQALSLLDTRTVSYSLNYINLSSSKVYYNYDATKSVNSTASGNYYVTATTATTKLIDNLTYAPGKNATSQELSISFTAYAGYGASSTASIPGVIRVHQLNAADFEVKASYGSYTKVDASLFQTFMQSKISNFSNNYEIKYVTFSNAPNSRTFGYLWSGYDSVLFQKQQLSPNSAKFYPGAFTDRSGYDLNDIFFVPAISKPSTQRATFTVYYGSKTGTLVSSKSGTIDFIIDETFIVPVQIKGSETYSAFSRQMATGYSYVIFTEKPVGGKLLYQFGTNTQSEVKLNTPYYLSPSAGQLALSQVTFVPTYGAKSGIIMARGYDYLGNSLAIQYQITVLSMSKSDYFSDVAAYSAYWDSIDFLASRGIMTGKPGANGTVVFAPGDTLTREEWVAMLYRAAGEPDITGLKNPFKDVKTSSWSYKAIVWAFNQKICKGTDTANTTFNPTGILTRQEIVQFMYNYAVNYAKYSAATTVTSLAAYKDADKVTWSAVAMKWALGNGYFESKTADTLDPTGTANRAEIADFCHRLLTK